MPTATPSPNSVYSSPNPQTRTSGVQICPSQLKYLGLGGGGVVTRCSVADSALISNFVSHPSHFRSLYKPPIPNLVLLPRFNHTLSQVPRPAFYEPVFLEISRKRAPPWLNYHRVLYQGMAGQAELNAERSLVCNVCLRSFSRLEHLQRHRRTRRPLSWWSQAFVLMLT